MAGPIGNAPFGNKANPFDNQLPKQLFLCRDITLN